MRNEKGKRGLDLLDLLEVRIKRNIGKNRRFKGRGFDLNHEYRQGWCDAMNAVLRRVNKMKQRNRVK